MLLHHQTCRNAVLSRYRLASTDLPAPSCRVYFFQNAEGTGLPPFECWLALRGLKTMKLRLDKASANAAALAVFLSKHPLVDRVNYAGLPGTPEATLNARQASSGGALLSFTTGNVDVSKYIVEKTRLFNITVSFGSTSSLISLPCYMSHASIPPEVREARGLPDDLVRISAGIEDIEDLIDDLSITLDGAQKEVEILPAMANRAASKNGVAYTCPTYPTY
jgi:cysteine-S-conjugate beta-lyase